MSYNQSPFWQHPLWKYAIFAALVTKSIFGFAVESTETIKKNELTAKGDWQPNMMDWQTSPVDLSFLNAQEKPAGKRGFVAAKGEQLVFEDGTQAKFWGVNITAYTVFTTPKDTIQQQAKKLSQIGFNLVRIHHIDSSWVNPNLFIEKSNDTKRINSIAMDRLDWWVKCLKEQGIYVWIDLHDGRELRSGDGIKDFDEIRKDKKEVNLKGYNYVNESIQKAMQDFNAAYLMHRNTYTGKMYTEEPAILAALITNENDVTHHFGNALLPDKGVKEHAKRYMQLAEIFSTKNDLDQDKTWRAWEHGPSKLFLNDLEYQFNAKMTAHSRGLGLKTLLVTTNFWGDNDLSSLPALTSGDMVDAHAYQGEGALKANPLNTDNFIHWLSSANVVGKPVSVTEWNADPFPVQDRHTLPMYMAAQSSFQGWDALMLYAYSQSGAQAPGAWTRASNWDSIYDPSLMATMPAAALMYRRGDVREAENTYVLKLDDDIFNRQVNPKNSAFIRTATELGKLQIAMPENKALPWLKKSILLPNAKVFKDPNQSLIKSNETKITNVDFQHDWQQGNLVINTHKTQGVLGAMNKQKFVLKDITLTSSTPNATVIVQAVDNAPISASENILISMAARSVTLKDGKLPFFSEPMIGQLIIKAGKGLKLYKRNQTQVDQPLPMEYQNGQYVINLDFSLKTYWLSLKKSKS